MLSSFLCWLLPLIGLLGAALWGGWIGWLLRRAKVLFWKGESDKHQTAYGTLKSDYDGYLI